MPGRSTLPPELRGTVFRGSHVQASGLLSRQQLRSLACRRLLRDVYADPDLPASHGLRIRAAVLLSPPSAVIGGRSACWSYGADLLAGPDAPVEVIVPAADRFGPVAGLRIRTVATLPRVDVDEDGGLRTTKPLRSAVDVARYASGLTEAVVCLDVILARGLVTPLRLVEVCAALPRARGCAQAARATELADGRAESPQESRLRVGLVLRGLTSFVPQYVVRHNGRFVARVDLAHPRRKLALEYDGRWHAAAAQLDRDRRRLNALAEAGWRVLFVTAPDLYRLDELADEVRAALGR